MATNPYVNKVVYDGTTIIDLSNDTLSSADQLAQGIVAHDRTGAVITGTGGTPAVVVTEEPDTGGGIVKNITALNISDTTAVASDVAQGKYFYTSSGVKTAGTASGGGGGLVYEEGTFTPSEDTTGVYISFTNTHTDRPLFVSMYDTGDFSVLSTKSLYYHIIDNFVGLTGSPLYSGIYGRHIVGYRNSNGAVASSTVTYTNETTYEYYLDPSQFRACDGSNYLRAGHTYKWIAVWAPTT